MTVSLADGPINRRTVASALLTDYVEWQPTLNFRGPRSLPVRWAA